MSDRTRPILDAFWYLLKTETNPDKRQTILAVIGKIETKGQQEGNSAKPHSPGARGWGREPWLAT